MKIREVINEAQEKGSRNAGAKQKQNYNYKFSPAMFKKNKGNLRDIVNAISFGPSEEFMNDNSKGRVSDDVAWDEAEKRQGAFVKRFQELSKERGAEGLRAEDFVELNGIAMPDRKTAQFSTDPHSTTKELGSKRDAEIYKDQLEPLEASRPLQHGRNIPYELKIVSKDGDNVIYEVEPKIDGKQIQLYGGMVDMRIANIDPFLKEYGVTRPNAMPDEWWVGKRIVASAVIYWPTEANPDHGYIMIGLSDYTKQMKKIVQSANKEAKLKQGAKRDKFDPISMGGATGVTLLINKKGKPVTSANDSIKVGANQTRKGSSNTKSATHHDDTKTKAAMIYGTQLHLPSHRVK